MAFRRIAFLSGFLAVASACGGSSGGNVTADAPIPIVDAPGPSTCTANGGACTTGSTCCSTSCDQLAHVCIAAGGMCAQPGAACNSPTDCCNLNACQNGHCVSATCTVNGNTCSVNADCCSSNCQGTTCQPVPGSLCTTVGNTCTLDTDCCSHFCSNGKCANAGGTTGCSATGDICFHGADCCTNVCNIASGASAGTCGTLSSTMSGGCMVDGEPCADGTNCCSRLCVPVSGGSRVCQTANGCRVIGDLCQKTSDCCGGAGNGLPPDTGSGMTVCNIISGTNPPVGTCGNPTGCDPEGDVCGLDVNARHDCCGCLPPKINCCKKDSLGVSRCYGGSTTNCPNGYDGTPGCCIPTGQICTFTNECCAGNTCLPDSNGILHCTSVSCVPSGGTCTSTEDCCPGSICNLPPGSLSGTCGPPHVMDGGVCSEAGQSCSSTQPCCMGLRCDTPELSGSCPVGRTDCTCKILIP